MNALREFALALGLWILAVALVTAAVLAILRATIGRP